MVKGVNKSVIEITDTGNKYFSKVLLFVSPEFVNKNSKKLNEQAEEAIKKLRLAGEEESLRNAVEKIRRRRLKLIIYGITGLLSIAALICVSVLL